jgi:ADP-sugar diphosphatase
VAIVPILICEGEEFAVITIQPRLATGDRFFKEIPAGMLDGDGNFKGVVVKELKEELGIVVGKDELVHLTGLAGMEEGVFMSPGGCDETIRIYGLVRHVTRDEMNEMNGKCTGAEDENEQIQLGIIPAADLIKLNDAKTLVGYSLYQRFRDQLAK